MGGRRLDSRSGGVSSARPVPPPADLRRIPDLPAARVRDSRPAGPLVASTAPAAHERTRPDQEPAGRFRRFARRHGWRAYAVPVLAVATVITLADLALTSPAETRSDGAGASAAAELSPGSPVRSPDAESSASVAPGPTASAEGDAGPTGATAPPAAQAFVERGAGTVTVIDGASAVLGSGPLRRFAVEVEDGIEVDARAFAAAVAETLGDPRSWGADGRMSFQRVGRAAVQAGQYDFKVSLISPGSMETYCPGVGTGGYTSCRYGERAVVNLARWVTAVPHYDGDLATYRHYVVNHEVGHVLGNGHVDCPGAGQVAPVMLQQTLGLEGCTKNAWPYP